MTTHRIEGWEDKMKILFAVPYIYDKRYQEFTKNRTGFGIMVKDIIDSVSVDNQSFIFSHVFTIGHGEILPHTVKQTILSLHGKDACQALKWFVHYRQDFKSRVRNAVYCLNKGQFRKYIMNIRPDIVHIHGIGLHTKVFIEVCEEERIPYVVTLHGLIGMNDSVSASQWDKQLEKKLLIDSEKRHIPVSVISTGMKKRIENNYLHKESSSISVITNGTDIGYSCELSAYEDLRDKYKIPNDTKIAVAVGSLCARKNQIQIVEAIAALSNEKRKKLRVFLCGADATSGYVAERIEKKEMQETVYCLGFVPHDQVEKIYSQADFNIVASLDEGFGLSIIEAYKYGLPTVTFGDLDAVDDLYNERSMIVCNERTTEAFAECIDKISSIKWDKNFIASYAKEFSLETMAKKYLEEYTEILKSGGVMPIAKTLDFIRIEKALDYKVLVYLANITDNKNQIQFVRIADKLPENCIAFLVGKECDGGMSRKLCIQKEVTEKIVFTGFCDEIASILDYCDLNVFLSKNDGFGLSIIEGYAYGVPSVMFADLDAAEDVFVDGAISYISQRDDEIVADFIEKRLYEDSNKEKIRHEASRFSMKNIGSHYIKWYEKNFHAYRNGD